MERMGAPKNSNRRTPAGPALSVDDRRNICRYSVVQTHAWLGWWEGEEFHNTNAQIVDISLRGCMMTVDQLPPKDLAVYFCPPGTMPSDWIEAKLIEAKRRLFGPRVVRIAFSRPFPYETFKHVVYGPDALGGQFSNTEAVPESERDYW
jgi:hypothetical protein